MQDTLLCRVSIPQRCSSSRVCDEGASIMYRSRSVDQVAGCCSALGAFFVNHRTCTCRGFVRVCTCFRRDYRRPVRIYFWDFFGGPL